jgi:hypothetical protein
MEQQFKKIIQKTKAWDQGLDPLAHTFAGALFKDSAWAFSFDESVVAGPVGTVAKPNVQVPAAPIAKPVSVNGSQSLVLFIGDSYVEGEDLLGKMIQAMKLKTGEFNRFPFNGKLEDINDLSNNLVEPTPETKELLEAIKKFKPQIVVSLGATVTNILLGKREKLSGIHGQFFEKDLKAIHDSYTYQIMPLFHPDFLIINPNMKRTAWIDLQLVMERVGKI